MASHKDLKGEPLPPKNHPFRSFSPSSERPRSESQIKIENTLLRELLKAIQAHDFNEIEKALSKCPDIDFIFSDVKPLVYAASLGQLDTVKLFASKGADMHRSGMLPVFIFETEVWYNDSDRDLSPVEAARRNRHDDVVEFLKKVK